MKGGNEFRDAIAVSNDKAELFEAITESFNRRRLKLESGEEIYLQTYAYPSGDVVRHALGRDFALISPSSTLWLQELEEEWPTREREREMAVVDNHSYAASPVVMVMRRDVAERFGYPEVVPGWRALAEAAAANRVRIMHAHGETEDGQLVTAAQHLAGQSLFEEDSSLTKRRSVGRLGEGESRAQTELAAKLESTQAFMTCIQQAVVEYGPDDETVIRRAWRQEEWQTDIIIAQENHILRALATRPELETLIVYPLEGTVWADHPLALLPTWRPEAQSAVFSLLRDHLNQRAPSGILEQYGLHRVAPQMASRQEVSQFYQRQQTSSQPVHVANAGAAPMVLPGQNVVRTIGQQWGQAKRAAAVCFVVDVSGSMASADRLPRVKAALTEFATRMSGDGSAVALIAFNDTPHIRVSLASVSASGDRFNAAVNNLRASGGTALLDALRLAVDQLVSAATAHSLKAIIALTDGQENASKAEKSDIERLLEGQDDVVLYAIGYGVDADTDLLAALAQAGRGFVTVESSGAIEDVYRQLRMYV